MPDDVERMEAPKRRRLARGERHEPNPTLNSDAAGASNSYVRTSSEQPLAQQRRAPLTNRFAPSIVSTKLDQDSKQALDSSEMPDLYGQTPPPSSTPRPNRYPNPIEISDDDSDDKEELHGMNPSNASLGTSTNKRRLSRVNIAYGFEGVKTEPLTDDMMKNTMFFVSLHGSPLGPVPVPFLECGNFNVIFPGLIEQRGVSAEDVKKVNNITWNFRWVGGEFGGMIGGIRKGKPGGWIYFCDRLRRAHESDTNHFKVKGTCEVSMILHVD